jgi:hypothetical protein
MPRKEQVAISRRGQKSTMPRLPHLSIRLSHTVGMQRNCGPENEHEHEKRTMDQRYGEDIYLHKRNRTVQRNIGMEKTTEKYKKS